MAMLNVTRDQLPFVSLPVTHPVAMQTRYATNTTCNQSTYQPARDSPRCDANTTHNQTTFQPAHDSPSGQVEAHGDAKSDAHDLAHGLLGGRRLPQRVLDLRSGTGFQGQRGGW